MVDEISLLAIIAGGLALTVIIAFAGLHW